MSGNPNTPDLEQLLMLGKNTLKSGNRQGAKMMFEQVLAVDKRNERAWLYLASLADTEVERRRLLETVIDINPANVKAKRYLRELDQATTSTEASSMRFGVRLLAIVIFVVVVALVIAFVIARLGLGA